MSYKLFTSSEVGEAVQKINSLSFSVWRIRGTVALRVAFGLVWAIDAWFKAQPAFVQNFTGYLAQARTGRPTALAAWITFWLQIVKLNPPFFAHAVIVGESGIALCLLLGAFFNLTCFAGAAVSVLIWCTARGFGSPYGPGSADAGVSLIYVLVFVGLFLGNAGSIYGVDGWLGKLLGRWSFLASGSTRSKQTTSLPPYASVATGGQKFVEYSQVSYSGEKPLFTRQTMASWQPFTATEPGEIPEMATQSRHNANARSVAIKGQRLSRM